MVAVTDLPAALAPWSAELSIFPRDLALDLGAMIRRLASLIGSAPPTRAGSGDFDGFDGVGRRGSYDRLLHSEWLIADELPDEFSRRAVMNEHLFLEVARTHPVQHPLSVALIDCGPSQIGTPRLVHIAALIVLARRAAASEATFRWGLLHKTDRGLIEGVRPTAIEELLDSRTPDEVSEAQIEEWQQQLAAGPRIGELWFLGPPRLARFPAVRKQWHLATDDVLQAHTRQVSAAVRHDNRNDPPIILTLPGDDHCVRLLRDPFVSVSTRLEPIPEGMRIASNLILATAGHALLGRSGEGDLVIQPYASTARVKAEQLKKARKIAIPPTDVLIAAGWDRGNAAIYVSIGPQGLRVGPEWVNPNARRDRRNAQDPFPVSGIRSMPGDLQPCASVPEHFGLDGGVAFIDSEGTLWNAMRYKRGIVRIAEQVVAMRRLKNDLVYLRRTEDDGWELGRIGQVGERIRGVTKAGRQAFFGVGNLKMDAAWGIAAVQLHNNHWLVVTKDVTRILAPPPGSTVIGAGRFSRQQPGLVCLEENRRDITLASLSGYRPVARASGTIATVAVGMGAPHAAWVTDDGTLEIVSLANRQLLHRAYSKEGW